VIQERDVNNLPTVTYTRGRDLSGSLQGAGGIGGLLARTDAANGQSACYHVDGNGNVTAMVNAQQIVVAKYTYDPFGNILSKSGPLADANTYRFSSQEYHQPSGLSLYLYRAYDPNLQRWLNRDPIQELGGINLYGFVGNDPLSVVDLWGFQSIGIPVPGSGGHGNCLSYAIGIDDDKQGGIQPKPEDRPKFPGGIGDWLDDQLKRRGGCKEKTGTQCPSGTRHTVSVAGNDDSDKGNPYFHVMVQACGGSTWSHRPGLPEQKIDPPIYDKADPPEKQKFPSKTKRKDWCCPCKK